ncbi:MAG: hypothetical protein LR011_00985 [Verrucomicrobia bacterium]|nr:hypothetical protein [Verrucomicrobiota bacterium]
MEMDGGRSEESIPVEMLLVAVAAGDLDSFERLYDHYSSVLYTIALNILRVPVDAEDVIQDVFVQLWEKSGEFDPERGSALSWMVTITAGKPSIDTDPSPGNPGSWKIMRPPPYRMPHTAEHPHS